MTSPAANIQRLKDQLALAERAGDTKRAKMLRRVLDEHDLEVSRARPPVAATRSG